MKLSECATITTKVETENGEIDYIRWKKEKDILFLIKELKNKLKLFDPEKENPCLSMSNRFHNKMCEQTINEVFK